jgi:hypothetical protein
VKLLTALEAGIGEKHVAFLKSEAFKSINNGVQGEFAAKIAEAEAPGKFVLQGASVSKQCSNVCPFNGIALSPSR